MPLFRMIERFKGPLGIASLILMVASLYAIFLYAPIEKVQGIPQKIFYIHVPLAWDSFLAFFVVFVGSVMFLWKRDREWDLVAYCSAEVGVILCSLVLITGPIWGKPIWGTWWTWDSRLTTTLILWLIFVAYLILRSSVQEVSQVGKFAAVLGIVGFLDIPIIHLSVLWWRTLHPKPVVMIPGAVASQLPPSMVKALLISWAAYTLLYLALLGLRLSIMKLRIQVDELEQMELRMDQTPKPFSTQ